MARQTNKFKTRNIDLASLLVANGHVCTTKILGRVYAEFSFDGGAEVEKFAQKFMKGECTVNITTFMYSRVSLKRDLQQKLLNGFYARKGKAPTPSVGFKSGDSYWFVEGGKVYKQLYAPREPHTNRIASGRAFKTEEEASAYIANLSDF